MAENLRNVNFLVKMFIVGNGFTTTVSWVVLSVKRFSEECEEMLW